jgi:hypothetical protein
MPKRAAIRRSRQPASQQRLLFELSTERTVAPFTAGLLKWIGSKQRMAHQIVSHFPQSFGRYYEPFVGSGAVLATLRPAKASASDTFAPLIEIWKTLHDAPDTLKQWYADRHMRMMNGDKVKVYEAIKAHYNANPNGADVLAMQVLFAFAKPTVTCQRHAARTSPLRQSGLLPVSTSGMHERKAFRFDGSTIEKRCGRQCVETLSTVIRLILIAKQFFTALSRFVLRNCSMKLRHASAGGYM